MGELHHAVTHRGHLRLTLAVVGVAMLAAVLAGCAPVTPTGPAASSGPPVAASDEPSPPPPSTAISPSPAAVEPGVGRLVWLVDRAGGFGVWTTDLAGGDVRAYLAGLDEAGTALREPRLVGEDVVVIRDAATPELWVVSQSAPPRLVLDAVEHFVVEDDQTVLAVRDQGSSRAIWRVATDGAQPRMIAELPLASGGPELGPFGFAISPDRRTTAAGWVGGPLEITGPAASSLSGVGAPLVVADDGRLVATTGRAGEAYRFEDGRQIELAPADSDPVAMPRSGTVAWGTVGDDGKLVAVEVRDLLAGTSETYPASGLATNVRELTPGLVILEATAFDPLSRTVTAVDRRDGRSATFEASAPPGD